jgi:hypothetical protein
MSYCLLKVAQNASEQGGFLAEKKEAGINPAG